MAAGHTVIVELVTSWLKTGKPAKVKSPFTIILEKVSTRSDLVVAWKLFIISHDSPKQIKITQLPLNYRFSNMFQHFREVSSHIHSKVKLRC